MANHKSAKKRCKQALKRSEVNRSLLSRIKNNNGIPIIPTIIYIYIK